MHVVGLTGGIATGKSTVANLLRARGVPVHDADRAARAVVDPGAPALTRLVDALGDGILSADDTLDRAALRRRIARDSGVRATVEAITHPAIRDHLAEALAADAGAGHPIAVVEAALLVETGSFRNYDTLVVVTCDPATQLDRLLARDGTTEADARALIGAQLPLGDKEAVAHVIIHNDGTRPALKASVDRAWAAVRARAGA